MASTTRGLNTIGFLKITKERIHLQCHVKPNSNASRVGIKPFSDTSSHLEVCVSSPARDNEANEGVVEVLSRILRCPKNGSGSYSGKEIKR
ncbi:hypothetical protein DID88_001719 [Monilinia fructigena]|uniref:Uncharacterized protein n=1 Tax=Monilinia fructigena TaxID=38457 RepID=A0A395IWK7_9HELO|nr:hypothetical protein DID88_001719 [Monilinia fructigena]